MTESKAVASSKDWDAQTRRIADHGVRVWDSTTGKLRQANTRPPWLLDNSQVEFTGEFTILTADREREIATIDSTILNGLALPLEVARANARLIREAPALLAEVKSLRDIVERRSPVDLTDTDALIARAEGRRE